MLVFITPFTTVTTNAQHEYHHRYVINLTEIIQNTCQKANLDLIIIGWVPKLKLYLQIVVKTKKSDHFKNYGMAKTSRMIMKYVNKRIQ